MKAPFTIRNLDHLVLRTTNVSRLVAFYESLGYHVEQRVSMGNLCGWLTLVG